MGIGTMKISACLVLLLVAFLAGPASAAVLPAPVVAAAADAMLSIIGISGLALITRRSERWPQGREIHSRAVPTLG
jgi:hypothetical protein